MPRPCSICTHRRRAEIEGSIVSGTPFRGISRQYRVSPDAAERHAKAHLPAAIVKSAHAAEVLSADNLVTQMNDLQRRTLELLDDAEEDGDVRLRAVAIHQSRENVAAVGRLLGQLGSPDSVIDPSRLTAEQISQTEGFHELVAEVWRILEPFPEATAALARGGPLPTTAMIMVRPFGSVSAMFAALAEQERRESLAAQKRRPLLAAHGVALEAEVVTAIDE